MQKSHVLGKGLFMYIESYCSIYIYIVLKNYISEYSFRFCLLFLLYVFTKGINQKKKENFGKKK